MVRPHAQRQQPKAVAEDASVGQVLPNSVTDSFTSAPTVDQPLTHNMHTAPIPRTRLSPLGATAATASPFGAYTLSHRLKQLDDQQSPTSVASTANALTSPPQRSPTRKLGASGSASAGSTSKPEKKKPFVPSIAAFANGKELASPFSPSKLPRAKEARPPEAADSFAQTHQALTAALAARAAPKASPWFQFGGYDEPDNDGVPSAIIHIDRSAAESSTNDVNSHTYTQSSVSLSSFHVAPVESQLDSARSFASISVSTPSVLEPLPSFKTHNLLVPSYVDESSTPYCSRHSRSHSPSEPASHASSTLNLATPATERKYLRKADAEHRRRNTLLADHVNTLRSDLQTAEATIELLKEKLKQATQQSPKSVSQSPKPILLRSPSSSDDAHSHCTLMIGQLRSELNRLKAESPGDDEWQIRLEEAQMATDIVRQAALAQMAASENIQSNLQAEIDVLSVRLAEAEADLVCARDDLTQSKSKQPLPNALDAITTQARMVVELQKDLSLLRAEFAIKNSECSELKQRLTLFSCPDQLLAEIEQLKASIAELKSEHESKLAAAIAEEKKTCAVACSELESKVASQQKEHQSQVSALTEQVQKLQQVEKDLRAQLAAEQQKSLEKSNLSKKNDAVKADEQAAAVQKAVTKATNQAAHTHRQQISKLERERADAERDLLKQIDSRKAELLEMGIQFEILKAEKDSHVCPRDLSQEVQRLQNQIRELHDASTKASEPVAKVLSAAQPASQSAAMSASGSTTIRERVREFGNQLCLHSFAILGVLFCVMMSILVSYMLRARSSYT